MFRCCFPISLAAQIACLLGSYGGGVTFVINSVVKRETCLGAGMVIKQSFGRHIRMSVLDDARQYPSGVV